MSSAGCPSLSYSAFRPTLHMRAATRLLSQLPVYTVISTRAPHEVERLLYDLLYHIAVKFQSTLTVRGATRRSDLPPPHIGISIHAPRAGSDQPRLPCLRPRVYFNPRSPCGERRQQKIYRRREKTISIHAPRAGSDCLYSQTEDITPVISIRAPYRRATI